MKTLQEQFNFTCNTWIRSTAFWQRTFGTEDRLDFKWYLIISSNCLNTVWLSDLLCLYFVMEKTHPLSFLGVWTSLPRWKKCTIVALIFFGRIGIQKNRWYQFEVLWVHSQSQILVSFNRDPFRWTPPSFLWIYPFPLKPQLELHEDELCCHKSVNCYERRHKRAAGTD